jgi:hypothetical protein
MRRGQHKPRYTLEWERERVKAWYEIAAADPMPDSTGAVGRYAEFDTRYEKLEAVVPTPVEV